MIGIFTSLVCAMSLKEHEDLIRIIGYKPLFDVHPYRLCWKEGDITSYEKRVEWFINDVKTSTLWDNNYLKTLSPYRPRPFDRILEMDYKALKAMLTLILRGESIREGYICRNIENGYLKAILIRFTDFMDTPIDKNSH